MQRHIADDRSPRVILIKHCDQWRDNKLLFTYILYHYLWDNKINYCKPRKGTAEFFWTRIFSLRLFHLCVYGAKSSVDIKTENCQICETFMVDAEEIHFLSHKQQWERRHKEGTTVLRALPIWTFPCICVFCIPKNQYIYGLMQIGTYWRFSRMQATNLENDNGKETERRHCQSVRLHSKHTWTRILVRSIARRNAVMNSDKNFLVYNFHIGKWFTSESFLGNKFQYEQEQNMQ